MQNNLFRAPRKLVLLSHPAMESHKWPFQSVLPRKFSWQIWVEGLFFRKRKRNGLRRSPACLQATASMYLCQPELPTTSGIEPFLALSTENPSAQENIMKTPLFVNKH